MQSIHLPRVNARYWTAITLASVFGTNLGDLYAHDSGLGIGPGLVVLAVLTATVFLIERRDRARHEAWYWLVIIIIRTGATNIADYLAFRIRIPPLILGLGLVALMAVLVWATRPCARDYEAPGSAPLPPATTGIYWAAMLTAGVLGTVLGDDASHLIGEGLASIGLAALLLAALFLARGSSATIAYWGVLAVARTAGTAIGDFIAEDQQLAIGLALSTLITGTAFLLVLIMWLGRNASIGRDPPPASSQRFHH